MFRETQTINRGLRMNDRWGVVSLAFNSAVVVIPDSSSVILQGFIALNIWIASPVRMSF